MRWVLVGSGALVVAAVVSTEAWRAGGDQLTPAPTTGPAVADYVRQAFHASYSLDYDEATTRARQGVTLGPAEPQAHRALASVLWLRILFGRGACTVDHFLGGLTKSAHSLPKPPSDLEAEFHHELALAISLAEARLARDAHDMGARQDAGAAYALQASYQASVEGSVVAAFRSAKRAYDAEEDVVAHDPQRAEANFVIGTYRYMVSALSLPSRVVAYLVGFGGGKERGIRLIEAATHEDDIHVDAKAALLLIYTREGRHLDALRMVQELEAEFPRNRLFVFEEGAAEVRAGLGASAEATLSRGLTTLDRDDRPKFPGERAQWLYTRAKARVELNHPADAHVDLDRALESAPVDWVRGRIHLELGKVADLESRRPDAVSEYRQARAICDATDDPICASDAGHLIKRPFKL
jgi:tetratricopeptide (TPR) repeat protein